MPRRHPDGRRRPGRRPPDRRSRRLRAPDPRPRPRGFSGPGWREFYGSFLPFEGRTKRLYFNDVSRAIVLGVATGGALFGLTQFGLLGGLAGLIAGAWAAGRWVCQGRYYRP